MEEEEEDSPYEIKHFPLLEREILIKQKFGSVGLGSIAWEGCFMTAHYVCERYPRDYWKGKKVIELGAGTGLVGIALSLLGADVTCTDYDEDALDLLRENLTLNHTQVNIQQLDWTEPLPSSCLLPWDFIVAAEVVYLQDTYQALIGYGVHNPQQRKFWELLHGKFEHEKVPRSDLHPKYRDNYDFDIFKLKKI